MESVLSQAGRWRELGRRVAVATVVATRRSAPRPVGSKLVVSENGQLAGSVSGGCVENDVVLAAQEVLAGGPPRLLTYGITDEMAFGVGLPCGGEIDVFVEELTEAGERTDVTLTVVAGEGVGERLDDPELMETARRRGRSHVLELGDRTVLADVSAPPPRLFVYGAVDTAEALCRAAKLLGWRTVVADARASFATPERIPSADELLLLWPDDALAQVRARSRHRGRRAHPRRQVRPAADPRRARERRVLRRLDRLAPQPGAAPRPSARGGRVRRRARRASRPVGLDIGADTPAETALSILAEILAVRAGRDGGRLRGIAPHRIHANRSPSAG